jgi:hypothetical protein
LSVFYSIYYERLPLTIGVYQVYLMIEELDHKEIRARLTELRILHREIDQKILDIQGNPFANQLQLRRLKKEKLYVKDCVQRLRARIIPDLNA